MFYYSRYNGHDLLNGFADQDYEVQKWQGFFGIVHFKHLDKYTNDDDDKISPIPEWVIEPHYDNIFRWGDIFVLSECGQVGGVRCAGGIVEWIAPCEYYAVDGFDYALVFLKQNEQRCYFGLTHTAKSFSVIYRCDVGPYMIADDLNSYNIINTSTGNVLWSRAKDDPHLSPYSMFGQLPCLVDLGITDNLPMFFDFENGTYIVPAGENKLDCMPDFPDVIMPIIVQSENVVNIVEKSSKIYACNYKECAQRRFDEDEGFDEITVEIKVTLKSEARTEERCYPIPHGTFRPGDVVDYFEWY